MPEIILTTIIKAPIETCFDLSRNIDLHKISTQGSDEEAIAGVTTGMIGMGEEVTWRATHLGIRQTLSSRITAFEYPYHFRDEMVKGLFKCIRHDHNFTSENGNTVMTDIFRYESPCGILGKVADWLFLKKYLEQLLVRRNKVIREYAENGLWPD
jgi:ligand-binding SRPBCC domain-containing protein